MDCMKSLNRFKKAVNLLENKEPYSYPRTEQIISRKRSELTKKLKLRPRSNNSS